MSVIIAPSVLSADFANLQRDAEMINQSEADWFHVDIMDGLFVPNISFGFPVVKALKKHANKPLDVHLMIVDPDRYLNDFKAAGADILSVHIEACNHLHRTIHAIKDLGMKAGVAVNPHTSVALLKDIIADAKNILSIYNIFLVCYFHFNAKIMLVFQCLQEDLLYLISFLAPLLHARLNYLMKYLH